MGLCFSKPDKKDILKDSREAIECNARSLAVCTELAENVLKTKVARLCDAVKYMTPTTSEGAMRMDKKISALAGDLKIVLSKGSERSLVQAEDIVKDLSNAIAERNTYTA